MAQAVAATVVQEPPAETRLPEEADKPQDPHTPKLMVKQRQGKLFKELDLSGLESWPLELADSVGWLLAEYDLGRFPHLWWKRFITTCERC